MNMNMELSIMKVLMPVFNVIMKVLRILIWECLHHPERIEVCLDVFHLPQEVMPVIFDESFAADVPFISLTIHYIELDVLSIFQFENILTGLTIKRYN